MFFDESVAKSVGTTILCLTALVIAVLITFVFTLGVSTS
jgi:hypothetical protein